MANDPVLTEAHLREMLGRAMSDATEDKAALPGDVIMLVGEVRRLNAANASRSLHIGAVGKRLSDWDAERDALCSRTAELEAELRAVKPDAAALRSKKKQK